MPALPCKQPGPCPSRAAAAPPGPAPDSLPCAAPSLPLPLPLPPPKQASGVKLGAIKAVVDGSVSVPTPYVPAPAAYNAAAGAADKVSTPVNIGTTEVGAGGGGGS